MRLKQILSVWVAILIVLIPVQTASALGVLSKVERIGSTGGAIDVVTDVPAEVKMKYGTSRSMPNELGSPQGRLHIFALSSLVSDTTYFYQFELTAGGQSVLVPRDRLDTFKTLDAIPPEKVTGLENTSVGTNYVTLSWDPVSDTDVDFYRVLRDQVLVGNATGTTFTDTGLEHMTTYIYNVAEVDTAPEQGPWSDPLQVTTLERDLVPPIISGAELVSLSATTATFDWTTNEPADTIVIYGTIPIALDQNRTITTKVLDHSVTIRELVNGTKYHYKLMSCDAEGNCANTDLDNFIAGMDIIPPFINAYVPEYVRTPDIEVEGTTEPFAFVSVFVNGGISGFLATDVTGRFSIRAINLLSNQPNTIRIEAQDQVGNKASREFTVIVDTKAPVVNMTELSDVVSKTPFNVQGNVNEPVTLKYAVSPTPSGIPDQVTDLRTEDIGQNTVTLAWHAVHGAGQYIVYREDQGRIAVVTNTTFTDTRVKTAANYEYQVSALAPNGEEGPLSSSLRVATLPNGQNIGDSYPELDLGQYLVNLSTATYNVTDMFNFELSLQEGTNYVTITFTDIAGNVLTVEREIVYDSTAPKILQPTSIEQYYSPSYSPTVTITGKVDTPGATVIVSVNERTTGAGVIPTSLFGIIEHFRKQGESYVVVADENGDFSVDIELERQLLPTLEGTNETVGGGAAVGSAVTDITGAQAADVSKLPSVANRIKIIAVDPSGLMSEPVEGIIEYKICGEGGAWEISIEDFSPAAIYSEHLLRGFAQFGFNMKLKYRGTGPESEAKIANVDVRNLPLSQYAAEKYSNLLEPTKPLESDDKKVQHLHYRLKKWPGTEDDLKKRHQLRFPLIVEIDYKEKVLGKEKPQVQKQCIDLRIELEHRIDLEGKIPEKFLNGSIEFIENAVDVIDDLLELLTPVQTYLFWGCLGSMGLTGLKSIQTELSCSGVKRAALGSLAREQKYPGWKTVGGWTCEVIGSADKAKCLSCVESIKSNEKIKKLRRWICDRMFCPSVPNVGIHSKQHRSMFMQIKLPNSACKSVEVKKVDGKDDLKVTGVLGDRHWRGKYGSVAKDDACKKEYELEWDSACLLMDEWDKATKPAGKKSSGAKLFDSIADICSGPDKPKGVTRTVLPNGELIQKDGAFYFIKPGESTQVQHGGQVSGDKIMFEGEKTDTVIDLSDKPQVGYAYDEYGDISEKSPYLYKDKEPQDGMISPTEAVDSNRVLDAKGKPIKHGDNSALDNSFEGRDAYVVNPSGGIIRSLQCACIPAVIGYLGLWRNILNVIKKCFQSILITKKADSGVCKAALTVYLCDFVFEALSCIGAKYTSPGTAQVPTGGIAGFFGSVSTGVSGVLDDVKGRYGETSMFKTMFSSQKLIHAACYFAWTGDWNLDIEGLLAGEARIPIESEVWLYPATRRFITSDPTNKGLATYIYHLGTGIIAGADLDYRIDLICTTGSDCQDGRNPGGACDCALTKEKQEMVYTVASGSLAAGEVFGDTQETGDWYVPHDIDKLFPYRFDKARITYWYTDNTGKRVEVPVVKDIGLVGPRPPSDCEFDIREGLFRCKYVMGENGEVFFAEKPEADQDAYYVDDTINLDIEVIKRSPEFDSKGSGSENAKKQLPAWLAWRVKNQYGAFLTPPGASSNNWQYELLKNDGEWVTNVAKVDRKDVLGPHKLKKIPDFKIKLEDFQNLAKGTATIITTIEQFEGEDDNIKFGTAKVLKTGSAVPNLGGKAETFAVCFYEKAQKYDVFSGGVSTDRKKFVVANPVETGKTTQPEITYHGIIIKLKSVAENSCVVIEQTSLPAGQTCQDGDWEIHLKLHHALPRNPDKPLSYDNYKPQDYGSVTMHNDKQQSYVIPVPVRCGVEEAVDPDRCKEGFNPSNCKCYKTSVGTHDFNCGGTANPFCVWGECSKQMNFKRLYDEARGGTDFDRKRVAEGLADPQTRAEINTAKEWMWVAGIFIILRELPKASESVSEGWNKLKSNGDTPIGHVLEELKKELNMTLLAKPPVEGGVLFYKGFRTCPAGYVMGGSFQVSGADCRGEATTSENKFLTLCYDKAFEDRINLTKAAKCPEGYTQIVEFKYNWGTTWGEDSSGIVLNADDFLRLCVKEDIAVQMYFHRKVCGFDFRSEGQLKMKSGSTIRTPLMNFGPRDTALFCVRKEWHDANVCGTKKTKT